MPTETEVRFVDYILDLVQDTGIRVALRSGLGRSVDQSMRMHAYLSRWTDSGKPHQEAVRYTVAALIAHNPVGANPEKSPGNVGASIAQYRTLAPATRESSVHLLARQPANQLCRMLTRIVVPLRSDSVAVDFAALVHDASAWPWQHTTIARHWLQAYYRADAIES
ncbi:type I-E CRISPR-associated protein Cse2/CasB [Nocardia sp. NPDC088792]|uniref:type I-E CRISPR-associated protein Cse2/CasB n=1 Tax=Nocardia sp. NPDC088792 TaxID=3364332 RepID=UPI0037FA2C8B